MLISTNLKVRVNSRTFKKYKKLGYNFEKTGDIIEIDYRHLSQYSEEILTLKCDYCGEIFYRKYADHYRILHSKNNYINSKDCCYNCKNIKQEEISMQKFGVKSSLDLPEIREKIQKTIFEKYGVDNISQLPEIQEKIRANNYKKYGVSSTSKLEITKQKVRNTNLERYGTPYLIGTPSFIEHSKTISLKKYGVPYPCMSEKIKWKIKHTNLKKYGCENVLENEEIRAKALHTKYKNGSQISSKQQDYFHKILGGELNYPFKKYFIDIAFPDKKIAVEYDGGGHNLSVKLGNISESKFKQLQIFRKKQLYAEGWKIITIISPKSKVLSKDETLLFFRYALYTFDMGRHWIEIHIDSKKIINSQKELKFTQITMND